MADVEEQCRQRKPARFSRIAGNATLKYLNLVSDKGLPNEQLAKLVNSEGIERQRALHEIARTSYPFLFKGFDLQRATTRQLEEEFGKVGAGGQTIRKCMAFFIAIAKDANIALSSHLRPFQGTSRHARVALRLLLMVRASTRHPWPRNPQQMAI